MERCTQLKTQEDLWWIWTKQKYQAIIANLLHSATINLNQRSSTTKGIYLDFFCLHRVCIDKLSAWIKVFWFCCRVFLLFCLSAVCVKMILLLPYYCTFRIFKSALLIMFKQTLHFLGLKFPVLKKSVHYLAQYFWELDFALLKMTL